MSPIISYDIIDAMLSKQFFFASIGHAKKISERQQQQQRKICPSFIIVAKMMMLICVHKFTIVLADFTVLYSVLHIIFDTRFMNF